MDNVWTRVVVQNQMIGPIEDYIKQHKVTNGNSNNKNVSGRPIVPIMLSDIIIMNYGDHTCHIIHKISIKMQYYQLIFASNFYYNIYIHLHMYGMGFLLL